MALPVPIERVSFGIRFGPRYGVGDVAGAIIDQILRGEGTPFGPEVFPETQLLPQEQRLTNPDTSELLVVSERDLLLSKIVKTRGVDEVSHLSRQFVRHVVEPAKALGQVTDVLRYGMLFHFAECSELLARPLAQHFLAEDCPEARDLGLRFSRRLPTDEAHFRKNVRDYKNLIYSLQQDEKGTSRISLDYQEYFDPPLDSVDWKKKPFENFAAAGVVFIERPFAEWVQKLLSKDKAA